MPIWEKLIPADLDGELHHLMEYNENSLKVFPSIFITWLSLNLATQWDASWNERDLLHFIRWTLDDVEHSRITAFAPTAALKFHWSLLPLRRPPQFTLSASVCPLGYALRHAIDWRQVYNTMDESAGVRLERISNHAIIINISHKISSYILPL